MATIAGTLTREPFYGVAVWSALDDGDVGSSICMAEFADKTVQAVGDATSVAIEGSNDNTNWFALTNADGDTIALAGSTYDINLIREAPLYVRPNVTGGTSTTVTIIGARG